MPNGFAVTVEAYKSFLHFNGAEERIDNILSRLTINDMHALKEGAKKARRLIRSLEFPPEVEEAIASSYSALSQEYGVQNVDVAIRSSATAEDLPQASFAGQLNSYLNVQSAEALLRTVRKCFASLFTRRAIVYRYIISLTSPTHNQ